MTETILLLDVDFSPEAAVSGAILLESESSTFLLFNAMQDRGGSIVPAGLAIAEFQVCLITKFGYPNDEAWSAIPRTRGLSYGLYEVRDSLWKAELAELNRHGFPEWGEYSGRHYLFLFHDSAFECIADGVSFTLTREPRDGIVARIAARIAEA